MTSQRCAATAVLMCALAAVELAAQDTPVGARAKGMGGSYTAFGDDATAIWYNPAGLATQRSKIAISYQSFVTYDFPDRVATPTVTGNGPGKPQMAFSEPSFVPSFAGVVLALGEEKSPIRHAFSLAYISPLNLNLMWEILPGAPGLAFQTRQKFSRFRLGYGADYKINPEGTGFFPHIAAGVAGDWGTTEFEERSAFFTYHENASAFGYAGGILLTVYDNREWFSADLGASYNSKVDFSFNLDQDLNPTMDWPEMYSIGVAFYIYALKITSDVQFVTWRNAVGMSALGGIKSFENTMNLGVGAEYSFRVNESLTALARLGYRRFDAPWGTKDPDTTGIGSTNFLTIDTKGEAFNLFTIGAGLYWSSPEGLRRGIDIAVEVGGDAVTIAVSYVHEF